jgi:uncharacterized protein
LPSTRPFSLLVKPASADCNLRCHYCFYLGHCSFYPEQRRHRMSGEVLGRMVSTYMRTSQPQYAFGWQGGEPTLMGVDFFRRAVELQKQCGRDGAVVGNGLQTNGTLLDAEFAGFIRQHNFLVGVSVDGPAAIHDHFRLTHGGGGSHDQVMRGIRHLADARAEFNILTLVSQSNVREADVVYDYLCRNNWLFHQYIPCVEFDADGNPLPFAIGGEEWGEFMCRIFDKWYAGDTRRVSVRHFDSVLTMMVDGRPNACYLDRNCCQYFVVEYNGDVFPCDFFVQKHLRLGNVATDSWQALQDSPVYREFGGRKCHWNPECGACEYLDVCHGDCLKNRWYTGGESSRRMSALCAGWKMFYAHTLERFRELAAGIRREREEAMRPLAVRNGGGPQVGRNAACPCGSGKKYKKCCGK